MLEHPRRILNSGACSLAVYARVLKRSTVQVHTLESSLGNEHLNASLFPSFPSAADFPIPLVEEEPESLSRLPAHNSQPDLSVGLVRRGTSPMLGMKRNPTSVIGPPAAQIRQSSLGIPTARKRQSLIGAASSHGRLFKVLGDFFILAGRTEDASVWCV
jgi:trafficking protein particle complex subunit 9